MDAHAQAAQVHPEEDQVIVVVASLLRSERKRLRLSASVY